MNIAIYAFNSSTDTLPAFNDGYTYDYTDVDNDDGTITRTIVSDILPTSISFRDETGLVNLSYLNTSNITSMSQMFRDCSNLTSLDLSNSNTSNVTSMLSMFYGCSNLITLDLSNFDTSNVNNMGYMFYDCKKLTTLDLSSFNTSVLSRTDSMFSSCSSLTTLNINNFNISKITDANINGMFASTSNLTKIEMKNSNIISINKIINVLSTRTIDSYGTLKSGAILASDCDIDTAKSKYWNIENDNIIAVYTFNKSTDTLPAFNSGFTNYYYADIDNGNDTITRTIANDDNSLPTSISFAYKTGLVSLSYLNTSNITNMGSMFNNCENLISIDVSSFDTSQVTDISHMFNRCYGLISINLSSFDTSKVTKMNHMFQECNALTTIEGLNSWNTSQVTDIRYMFDGCIELIELNLSNFNTSKVTTMYSIFQNCKKLGTLNINNFNINSTVDTGWMFYNCENLISVNMEDSNTNTINSIISNLPTRTSNNEGTLIVPNPKDNAINISSAQSKYWNLVAPPQYAFDIDTITYFISKIKEKFAVISELKNKVDKEEGKNLSTNNFSNEEKDHIENSFNDVTLVDNILVFYSTSESGDKVIVETFDLDI